MSTRQVEMRNSERRRRALVRSCACMRLESAIRTVIAAEWTAGDGLTKRGSERTRFATVLMVGVGGAVLKGTCHIICLRLSNRENGRRRCGKAGSAHSRKLGVLICSEGISQWRGFAWYLSAFTE